MKINTSKRKIGYTYRSLSGEYSFRGKSISHESSIERDFLAILEFNSNVKEVIGQPITIPYQNHNYRDVTYTPDFLVHFYNQKSWLVEIKERKDLKKNWPKYRHKCKIGFKHAKDEGWLYHLFHESKIRNKILDRSEFLRRFKFHTGEYEVTDQIVIYLKTIDHVVISQLINHLFPTNDKKEIVNHIWHLITKQILFCNLSYELNPDSTVIWLNHNSGIAP